MVVFVDDDREDLVRFRVHLVAVELEFLGRMLTARMDDDFVERFQIGDTVLNRTLHFSAAEILNPLRWPNS